MTTRSLVPRLLLAAGLSCQIGLSSRADVIQVDVHAVLTGRAVTTFTDGGTRSPPYPWRGAASRWPQATDLCGGGQNRSRLPGLLGRDWSCQISFSRHHRFHLHWQLAIGVRHLNRASLRLPFPSASVSRIPTGFSHRAQGCEARATPSKCQSFQMTLMLLAPIL